MDKYNTNPNNIDQFDWREFVRWTFDYAKERNKNKEYLDYIVIDYEHDTKEDFINHLYEVTNTAFEKVGGLNYNGKINPNYKRRDLDNKWYE